MRTCAVLALLLLALSACRDVRELLGIRLELREERLSNGLKIILVEDHTVPIVSYQTWVKVGSVDETPGNTGISHYFEHLMFKGTPKYGPRQFFLQLEAKGAEVNAYTTRDYTAFYDNFTPNLLPLVVDMEADRLANLNPTEEMLQVERQVVLEERRLRTENSPGGKIQEALWRLAYHRHPYHFPVIGDVRDVLSVTVEDLRRFFKKYYVPSNVLLVVVGDINPGETVRMIRAAYGGIPSALAPKREIAVEPQQNEERRLIIRDAVASERFAHGYHITRAEDDESYAVDVLANVLFEGSSSRGYRRLVEELDLAVSLGGTSYTPTFPGLLIVSGTMREGVPASRAESALDALYEELKATGVTQEEVDAAVRQLTVMLVDSVRTPSGLGQLIGTVQLIFGDPKRFADDLAKYHKVTPARVKEAALKYLHPNNRSIVTVMR